VKSVFDKLFPKTQITYSKSITISISTNGDMMMNVDDNFEIYRGLLKSF
jgi:hypothetical protein